MALRMREFLGGIRKEVSIHRLGEKEEDGRSDATWESTGLDDGDLWLRGKWKEEELRGRARDSRTHKDMNMVAEPEPKGQQRALHGESSGEIGVGSQQLQKKKQSRGKLAWQRKQQQREGAEVQKEGGEESKAVEDKEIQGTVVRRPPGLEVGEEEEEI